MYSDASGPEPGTFLSVAAVFCEKEKAKELNRRWEQLLAPILKDQPANKRYFHMTEFMAHESPYDILHMTQGGRDALQRGLIDAIHDCVDLALIASVRTDEFAVSTAPKDVLGGPHTMCCVWCIERFATHMDETNQLGEIACFLELGDREQDALGSYLNFQIAGNPSLNRRFRFGGHSFIPKTAHHALAAADMIAWEQRTASEKYLADPDQFNQRVLQDILWSKRLHFTHFHRTRIHERAANLIMIKSEECQRGTN
jgi:hypothetical protein